MGDISPNWDLMSQPYTATELSTGWSFKQTDDDSNDAWLSVKKVPSEVHQDLMDHKKYVLSTGTGMD